MSDAESNSPFRRPAPPGSAGKGVMSMFGSSSSPSSGSGTWSGRGRGRRQERDQVFSFKFDPNQMSAPMKRPRPDDDADGSSENNEQLDARGESTSYPRSTTFAPSSCDFVKSCSMVSRYPYPEHVPTRSPTSNVSVTRMSPTMTSKAPPSHPLGSIFGTPSSSLPPGSLFGTPAQRSPRVPALGRANVKAALEQFKNPRLSQPVKKFSPGARTPNSDGSNLARGRFTGSGGQSLLKTAVLNNAVARSLFDTPRPESPSAGSMSPNSSINNGLRRATEDFRNSPNNRRPAVSSPGQREMYQQERRTFGSSPSMDQRYSSEYDDFSEPRQGHANPRQDTDSGFPRDAGTYDDTDSFDYRSSGPSSPNRRFERNTARGEALTSSGYSSRAQDKSHEFASSRAAAAQNVASTRSWLTQENESVQSPSAVTSASRTSAMSSAVSRRQSEKKYLYAAEAEKSRADQHDVYDGECDDVDEPFINDGYPEILTAPSDMDMCDFDDAMMEMDLGLPDDFLEDARGGAAMDRDGGEERDQSRPARPRSPGGFFPEEDDKYYEQEGPGSTKSSSREAQGGSSGRHCSPDWSRQDDFDDIRGSTRTPAAHCGSERPGSSKEANRGSSRYASSHRSLERSEEVRPRRMPDGDWSDYGSTRGEGGYEDPDLYSAPLTISDVRRRRGEDSHAGFDDYGTSSNYGQPSPQPGDSFDWTSSDERGQMLDPYKRTDESEEVSRMRGSTLPSAGFLETSNRATYGARSETTSSPNALLDSPRRSPATTSAYFSLPADGTNRLHHRGTSIESTLSSSREANLGSSPRTEATAFTSPQPRRRTQPDRSDYFSSLPDTSMVAASHITACQRPVDPDMDDYGARAHHAAGNDAENRSRANFQLISTFVRHQGRTGAAIFDVDTGIMHFMPSVTDPAPEFAALRKVLCQENPGVVLISARTAPDFVSKLRNILYESEDVPQGGQDPQDQDLIFGSTFVEMKPNKDFMYSGCLQRLANLKMDGRGGKTYLRTIIDSEDVCTVRACGAMLKHVSDSGLGPVTDVVALKIDYALTFDPFLLSSLDIFNADQHPSVAFKSSTKREGVSIYSILNRCKSTIGSKFLKSMLSRPTRDLAELNERFATIHCLTQPKNAEIRGALASNCRFLRPLKMVLERMGDYQASPRFWKNFGKTLLHLVMLGQLCRSMPLDIQLFRDLAGSVTGRLQFLVGVLDRIVDTDASMQNNRFTVRPGLDSTLDEMRRCYEGLGDFLGRVSNQQLAQLPEVIDECSLTYVPQVGFLVCVDEAAVTAPSEDDLDSRRSESSASGSVASKPLLHFDELELLFRADGKVFYKSTFCGQLDVGIGDVLIMIIDLEVSVMMALTEDIMSSAEDIHRLVRFCAELDCYVGLAEAALEYNLVKPELVMNPRGHVLDIVNGRHLLQEKCSTSGSFIPNSVQSGLISSDHRNDANNQQGKIHILTGPNASGKSVLLKQVGLIVYLAHVGCFVPAEAATISVVDGIFSRIKSSESLASGMSSFMAEASQMAFALRNSSGASLLLIDEFGRGTKAEDGACLLSSVVDSLSARGQADCPHTFLATHFHELKEMLEHESDRESSMVKFCRMEFMVSADDIVYLYQLVPGRAKRSFPEFVALGVGVHRAIVDRSREIAELNADGRAIGPVPFVIERDAGESDQYRRSDEEEAETGVVSKAELIGDVVNSPRMSFEDFIRSVLDLGE